jgi:hypothetical protein
LSARRRSGCAATRSQSSLSASIPGAEGVTAAAMRCQIMWRIGGRRRGRGGDALLPPSLPLGFSLPMTREQLVEPRTGGSRGRDRVGGRLVLIFSVDSAAECFGAGWAAARQAEETEKKGTRRDVHGSVRSGGGRRETARAVAASREDDGSLSRF